MQAHEYIANLEAMVEALNERVTMLEKVVFIDTDWMSPTQKHAIGAEVDVRSIRA